MKIALFFSMLALNILFALLVIVLIELTFDMQVDGINAGLIGYLASRIFILIYKKLVSKYDLD